MIYLIFLEFLSNYLKNFTLSSEPKIIIMKENSKFKLKYKPRRLEDIFWPRDHVQSLTRITRYITDFIPNSGGILASAWDWCQPSNERNLGNY